MVKSFGVPPWGSVLELCPHCAAVSEEEGAASIPVPFPFGKLVQGSSPFLCPEGEESQEHPVMSCAARRSWGRSAVGY